MQFPVNSIINEYFRFCSILNNILGIVEIFLLIWQVLDKNFNLNVAMIELLQTSANYNRFFTNPYYYVEFITHCYFQLFTTNMGVPYMLAFHAIIYFKFYVMLLNLKLATMNPRGWYPPPVIVVDNTGNAWGTSSAIKGSDGFSNPSLCIFSCFFSCFLKKLRLAKKSWNSNCVLWNNSLFEIFN